MKRTSEVNSRREERGGDLPRPLCLFRELTLSNSTSVALVDTADYDRLARYRWRLKRGYVYRHRCIGGKWRQQYLSHAVLGIDGRHKVQFNNGNSLDCRRENLCLFRRDGGSVYVNARSRRNPYRIKVSVDGMRFDCGGWPRRSWAEASCADVARVAQELRGRGLSRREIQRALDRAGGSRDPPQIRRRLRDRPEEVAELLERIDGALPRSLSPEAREDARQSVFLAVLAGELSPGDITPAALRPYARGARGMAQDRYKFISLSQPTHDGREFGDSLAA